MKAKKSIFICLIAIIGLCVLLFNFYYIKKKERYFKNNIEFSGSGLRRFFYSNVMWEGNPDQSKIDYEILFFNKVDEDFNRGQFSIKWAGGFYAERSGVYKFYLRSDDGSQLFIDKKLVINNDGIHPADKEVSKKIFLWKGLHYLRIGYFQDLGLAEIEFHWRPIGIGRSKSNDLSVNFYPVKASFNIEKDAFELDKIFAFRRNGNYFLLGAIFFTLINWFIFKYWDKLVLTYNFINIKLKPLKKNASFVRKVRYFPYIFLTILILVIYSELIFLPKNIAISGDSCNLDAACRYIFKKSILENREIPLWNPYWVSGTPFIGRSSTCYNPLHIIVLLLTSNVQYGCRISVFLHILMAAFGMYILLEFVSGKNIFINMAGAFLYISTCTYLKFMFAGNQLFYPASYLPLVYFLFLKASSKWLEADISRLYYKLGSKYFILAAFIMFLQIISGGGEVFLFTSIILNFSFIVILVWTIIKFNKRYHVYTTYFIGYSFMWLTTLLLSAFYLFPLFAKYPFGNRLTFIPGENLGGCPTIANIIGHIRIGFFTNYHPVVAHIILFFCLLGLFFLLFKKYRRNFLIILAIGLIPYLILSVAPSRNTLYKLFFDYYPTFKMQRNFPTRGYIVIFPLVLLLANYGQSSFVYFISKYSKKLSKILVLVIFLVTFFNCIWSYRKYGRFFIPPGVVDGNRTIISNSIDEPLQLQAWINVKYLAFSKKKRYCLFGLEIKNISHNHVWFNTVDIPESKRLYVKFIAKNGLGDLELCKYVLNKNVYPQECVNLENKFFIPEGLFGEVEIWVQIGTGSGEIVRRKMCIFYINQGQIELKEMKKDIQMSRLGFSFIKFFSVSEKEKVRFYFNVERLVGFYTATVFDIEHTGLWESDGLNYFFPYFNYSDQTLDLLYVENFEKKLVEEGDNTIKKFSILNTKYFFLEKELSNCPSFLDKADNQFGIPMYINHNYLKRITNPVIPILYIGKDINEDFNSSIVKQLVECKNFDPHVMAIYHGNSEYIDDYDENFLNRFRLIVLGNYFVKDKKIYWINKNISKSFFNVEVLSSNDNISLSKNSLTQFNNLIGCLNEEVKGQPEEDFSFEFLKYTNNTRKFSLKGLRTPFIFYSEVFYHGWKAFADGNKQKVFMCNGIGVGIVLDNLDEKEVLLEYKPSSFIIGAWISGFSLLLLFLVYKLW